MRIHSSTVGASRRFKVLPRTLLWSMLCLAVLASFGCAGVRHRGITSSPTTRTFTSQNFFSMDYPGDWVTRDLNDGANLFYSEELIFVRIKILEPPDPRAIHEFMAEKIKADADLQGGQVSQLKTGSKGANPFTHYLITKPNGQRFEEILVYNDELKLLYVIFGSIGSGRSDDFDEFSKIFQEMFDSFAFKITARLPHEQEGPFTADYSTLQGTWTAYLEGLRSEDFDLLQRSCARINGSKIINDENVRKVKTDYFPYNTPVYTFVSHVEIQDKVANVDVAVRALPPDGYLRHETRKFIKEEDHWRLLQFERAD